MRQVIFVGYNFDSYQFLYQKINNFLSIFEASKIV